MELLHSPCSDSNLVIISENLIILEDLYLAKYHQKKRREKCIEFKGKYLKFDLCSFDCKIISVNDRCFIIFIIQRGVIHMMKVILNNFSLFTN